MGFTKSDAKRNKLLSKMTNNYNNISNNQTPFSIVSNIKKPIDEFIKKHIKQDDIEIWPDGSVDTITGQAGSA